MDESSVAILLSSLGLASVLAYTIKFMVTKLLTKNDSGTARSTAKLVSIEQRLSTLATEVASLTTAVTALEQRPSFLTDDQQDILRQLYRMHDTRDNDGIPMWFTPRSWRDLLIEIVQKMRDLSGTDDTMMKLIETISNRLEAIRQQQDKHDTEMRAVMSDFFLRLERAIRETRG